MPEEDLIAATNLRVYDQPSAARYWSSYSDALMAAEATILEQIGPELRGRPILDVGVGGGRTTPHLLGLSADYLGIDFSAEMVAACRQRFPGVQFAHCDARAMAPLGRDGFALVFFSFNGIDYVNHQDRLKVYASAREVLADKGYFCFSSHNLRDERERQARPWHFTRSDWRLRGRPARDLARTLYHTLEQFFYYGRLRAAQVHGPGYAVLLDRGQRFRMLTYFIDPVEQARQLEASGFGEIRIFDRNGVEHAAGSTALDGANPVHYLARKI